MHHLRIGAAAAATVVGLLGVAQPVAVATPRSVVVPAVALPPPFVSTVLPTHIEIGAATSSFTADTVTTNDVEYVEVDVSRNGDEGRGEAETKLGGGPRDWRGTITVDDHAITGWGTQYWGFVEFTGMHNYDQLLPADIRAHSLLGLTAARSGDTVTIHGSARAWNTVPEHYSSWSARPVAVQRWTSTGWATLTTVDTDSHGNLDVRLHIPFRVGLRLVDAATSTIWGQTTGQTIA